MIACMSLINEMYAVGHARLMSSLKKATTRIVIFATPQAACRQEHQSDTLLQAAVTNRLARNCFPRPHHIHRLVVKVNEGCPFERLGPVRTKMGNGLIIWGGRFWMVIQESLNDRSSRATRTAAHGSTRVGAGDLRSARPCPAAW
jgi:hypothetical protein